VAGEQFDSSIEERTIKVRRGDVLVFFTDGFSEAMNLRGDLYSDERLMEIISEKGHLGADQILESIVDEVKEFVGEAEQHDDMTMIVVKLDDIAKDE